MYIFLHMCRFLDPLVYGQYPKIMRD